MKDEFNDEYNDDQFDGALEAPKDEYRNLKFVVRGEYLFESIDYIDNIATFKVAYIGKDKKSLSDLYTDIIDSDEMKFKISIILGSIIAKTSGYVTYNDNNKTVYTMVEYLLKTSNNIIDIKDLDTDDSVPLFNSIEPMIDENADITTSQNLVEFESSNEDIMNKFWVYVNTITFINNSGYIKLSNSNFMQRLYQENVLAIEDYISSRLTSNGLYQSLNIKYNTLMKISFSLYTIRIEVRFSVKSIFNLQVIKLTKNNIIIEENEDIDKNGMMNILSTAISQLFSNSEHMLIPRMITKNNQLIKDSYDTSFSSFTIDNYEYSIINKNAMYSYSKNIYNTTDINIYVRNNNKLFDKSEKYLVCVNMHSIFKYLNENEELWKICNDKFKEDLKNVIDFKKYRMHRIISIRDEIIYFTLT